MTNLLSLPVLPTDHWRPKTRGDCVNEPRPCPYVGCVHHLYLEVSERGNIVFRYPGKEPEDLEHSCALDIADKGGLGQKALASKLGVSKQAVQQCEDLALRKLLKNGKSLRVFR